jgi:hypothetical protein
MGNHLISYDLSNITGNAIGKQWVYNKIFTWANYNIFTWANYMGIMDYLSGTLGKHTHTHIYIYTYLNNDNTWENI